MITYDFYAGVYMGESIPEAEFLRLSRRAEAQLARYKRIYTVTAPEKDSEKLAICAMADALYYYEVAQNGGLVTSSSIGSVSSSYRVDAVDISPAAQSTELYRSACLYLNIYRGH